MKPITASINIIKILLFISAILVFSFLTAKNAYAATDACGRTVPNEGNGGLGPVSYLITSTYICGFVTDTDSNPVPGVRIDITSTVGWLGTVYTDATGYWSSSVNAIDAFCINQYYGTSSFSMDFFVTSPQAPGITHTGFSYGECFGGDGEGNPLGRNYQITSPSGPYNFTVPAVVVTPPPTIPPTIYYPDLVSSIQSISPGSGMVNQAMNFTIQTKNQGLNSAGASLTAYAIFKPQNPSDDACAGALNYITSGGASSGGWVLGPTNTSISPLGLSSNQNSSFSWTPTSGGNYCVVALADSNGQIYESDEGNNLTGAPFNVDVAPISSDLTVTSINSPNSTVPNAYDQPIPTYHINDDIKFNAVVKNIGANTVGDTVTRFRLDLNNDGSFGDEPYFAPHRDMITSSINPNDTQNISTIWVQALPVGTHKLEVCADGGNQINETNETNNCATFIFAVRSMPNLRAVMTNKPTTPPTLGTSYSFKGYELNSKADPTGRVPNSTANIAKFCYGPNNNLPFNCSGATNISQHNIPGPIEGGGLNNAPNSRSAEVTANSWVIPPLPSGATYWSVLLCADDSNVIAEDGMFGDNGNAESDNCDVYNFTPAPPNIPPCSIDLKVNGSDGPISIPSGSNANLSWTSSNDADGWLQASGAWSGLRLSPYSESVGPLTSSATYILTGYNSNSQLCSDSVNINVTPIVTPTPTPTATPTTTPNSCNVDLRVNGSNSALVNLGSNATLSWNSSNDADGWLQATSNPINAPGPWDGMLKLEVGSQNVGPINSNSTYTLTGYNSSNQPCSDTVTVNVSVSPPPITPPPSVMATPTSTPTPTPGPLSCVVDLKANGSDAVILSAPDYVTLSWTSQNDADGWLQASSNPLNAPGSWNGTLKFESGSQIVGPITSSTIYTLTGFNSFNVACTKSITIGMTVSTPPPSVSPSPQGIPWLQTRGGDVHSNDSINTPGGPQE